MLPCKVKFLSRPQDRKKKKGKNLDFRNLSAIMVLISNGDSGNRWAHKEQSLLLYVVKAYG